MAFVYHDQENNLRPRTRLASSILNQKVEKQQECKRSVLGVINVDNAKVSSSRYKKETKKVKCLRQNLNTFAVYEDSEETTKDEILEEEEYKSANESPSKRFKDDLSAVLDLPSKFISADLQTRQPLHDVLDSSGTSDEGSLSGKSFNESPMSIDRTISPIERPSKSRKRLFDCDMYSDDILAYLMKIEKLHRPKPLYMRRQPEINYSMRTILVDWLVEVAQEYKLHTETLFLAVSFIDRFLSVMSVIKSKLQLLGTAAMFVASKYEEIYPPQVSDFVFITDDTYTIKQVLRMEYLILKVLAFDISGPTVITFMKHFAVRCDIPEKIIHLATYLSELVLLEGDPYLGFTHSHIAAATILMARHLLNHKDLWPVNYFRVTGYPIEDLVMCIEHLNRTHENAKTISVEAVNIKYKSNTLMNVASIEPKYLDLRAYILQTTQMRPFGMPSF